MRRSPLQKKKTPSRNFMIPDENVLDLRSKYAQEPKKYRGDDYHEYFETEYKDHVKRSVFRGFLLSFKTWFQNRKEQKLAKKLSSLHSLPLDNSMQKLLFEAQKDRLDFSHHHSIESLQNAEEKYKTIKQSLKLKKPVEIPRTENQVVPVVEKKEEVVEVYQKMKAKVKETSEVSAAKVRGEAIVPEFISSQNVQPKVVLERKEEEKDVVEKKVELQIKDASDNFNPPVFPVFSRLFVFVIICFVLIVPFVGLGLVYPSVMRSQGKVLGVSTTAVSELSSAGSAIASLDFNSADQNFDTAFQNFLLAQDEIEKYSLFFHLIPVKGSEGQAAQNLIQAGAEVSAAGKYMSRAVQAASVLRSDTAASGKVDVTATLSEVSELLKPAVSHLKASQEYVSQVPLDIVPEEYQETFTLVQSEFPTLVSLLGDFVETSDVLLALLGHDTSKHYLIIFQNNQEIRPTGGFMGSFAVVTLDRGVVENINVPGGGIYDVAGQLGKEYIAPQPLHLVNPYWNIQDANWFPDFPSSAQKIMDFYEMGGGMTTDGVIAVTPEVLEKFLELTGPIYLRGEEITHENIIDFIEQEKEEVKDTETPKSILGELTPILLNKALHLDNVEPIQILAMMDEIMSERDFMMYFRDRDLQNLVQDYGWSGALEESDRDYLHVNHANISGGKTDHLIEERIEHKAQISNDGKIVDTVLITRTHRGNSEDEKEGVKNTVYTRLYVPKGSKLISAQGFSRIDPTLFQTPSEDAEIDQDLKDIQGEVLIDEYSGMRISEEFGKQVFGNWLSVAPGDSIQAMITYELPFTLETGGFFENSDYYRLYIQKQPGAQNSIFSSRVEIPESFEVWWKGPDALTFEDSVFIYEDVLEHDIQFGFVVTP